MKLKGLPMTREIATRAQIALLVYLMTNSVLFGAGVTPHGLASLTF
jgi:hypothetical protein